MKLYHGTSDKYLPKILKQGLKPRGRRNGNWKHTILSNPRAVYMTVAYPLYYSLSAVNNLKTEKGMILEIDSDKLNPFKFAPDEDFLEQATRGQEHWAEIRDMFAGEDQMNLMTAYFRDSLETDWTDGETWRKSIKGMGNCCYFDTVPVEAITRIAILPNIHKHIMWSDPTITLMNFYLMGDYYKALSGMVFGDPIPEEMQAESDELKKLTGHAKFPPPEVFSDVKVLTPQQMEIV